MKNDETERMLAAVDRRRLLAAAASVGLVGAGVPAARASAAGETVFDRLGGDVLQTMAEANADRFTRVIRSYTPAVIEWTSEAYVGLFPPGCIAVLFARKGSRDLADVSRWVAERNSVRLNEFGERLWRQFQGRTMVTLKEAARRMLPLPVYGDLRYESQSLAQYIHVPDDAGPDFVGFSAMPFSGGRLDDRQFSFHEYVRSGGEAHGIDVLLVRRPPRLDDIVRAALERVPQTQLGINMGDSSVCWAITALVLAAVGFVAAIGVTATTSCQGFYDRLDQVSLPQAELDRLGPVASARKLLQMRREILVGMEG